VHIDLRKRQVHSFVLISYRTTPGAGIWIHELLHRGPAAGPPPTVHTSVPSPPRSALRGQRVRHAGGARLGAARARQPLLEAFAAVPGQGGARGVRHGSCSTLATPLLLAVSAVRSCRAGAALRLRRRPVDNARVQRDNTNKKCV
jgi:hypothetical protein